MHHELDDDTFFVHVGRNVDIPTELRTALEHYYAELADESEEAAGFGAGLPIGFAWIGETEKNLVTDGDFGPVTMNLLGNQWGDPRT